MGAEVSAYDVRAQNKLMVEQLGGKFLEIQYCENGKMKKGGCTTELHNLYKTVENGLLQEWLSQHDIVITTAVSDAPYKKPPLLLTHSMISHMKPH